MPMNIEYHESSTLTNDDDDDNNKIISAANQSLNMSDIPENYSS